MPIESNREISACKRIGVISAYPESRHLAVQNRCPLWVISRHVRRKKRCPLYPR
jgi:hypothetical protein